MLPLIEVIVRAITEHAGVGPEFSDSVAGDQSYRVRRGIGARHGRAATRRQKCRRETYVRV
jgi:hypothetical protein